MSSPSAYPSVAASSLPEDSTTRKNSRAGHHANTSISRTRARRVQGNAATVWVSVWVSMWSEQVSDHGHRSPWAIRLDLEYGAGGLPGGRTAKRHPPRGEDCGKQPSAQRAT